MDTELNPKSDLMSEIVLGNLSAAILVISDQRKIVFANQAAENLLR